MITSKREYQEYLKADLVALTGKSEMDFKSKNPTTDCAKSNFEIPKEIKEIRIL